jgi:hypothetical protein
MRKNNQLREKILKSKKILSLKSKMKMLGLMKMKRMMPTMDLKILFLEMDQN